MTTQGSAYPRFRRALAGGNLTIIRAEAAELPYIELSDALRITALMAERDDPAFEPAACRSLARLALERPVGLTELRNAVRALERLPDLGALKALERLSDP